jgi:hypothetical protein
MLKLELSFANAAANNVAVLPAKSDAPLASVVRRNSRRLMRLHFRWLFAPKAEFFIGQGTFTWSLFTKQVTRHFVSFGKAFGWQPNATG